MWRMCFTLVLTLAVILSNFFLLSGGGWYQQGNRHILKFVHPIALIKQAPSYIPLCNAACNSMQVATFKHFLLAMGTPFVSMQL